MTVLLDNKGQGKVGDALGKSIQADARLSVLSGLFSIYGYAVLKNQLAQIDALRLLIPSNDAGSMLPGDKQPLHVAGLAGDDGDRRFRNSLNLTEIARECAGWLEQKADITLQSCYGPGDRFGMRRVQWPLCIGNSEWPLG